MRRSLGRLAARLAEVDHQAECTIVLIASVDDLRAVHDAFGHTEATGHWAISNAGCRTSPVRRPRCLVSVGDELALLVPGSRAEHARQLAAEVAEAVLTKPARSTTTGRCGCAPASGSASPRRTPRQRRCCAMPRRPCRWRGGVATLWSKSSSRRCARPSWTGCRQARTSRMPSTPARG